MANDTSNGYRHAAATAMARTATLRKHPQMELLQRRQHSFQ